MATGMPEVEPRLNADAFNCALCGAYANQSWGVARYLFNGSLAEGYVGGAEIALSLCARCGNNSVWVGNQLVYPLASLGPEPSPDMPEDVASLYNEARAVAVVSRRAGAAMARASLELLTRHVDAAAPRGARLVDRLDRIIPTVDSSLGQMLTFVRHAGNAIHVSEQPDDAVVMMLDDDQTEAMDLIFAAINGLVDEKITRPRVAAEMYERIPESVRKRVERASKKGSER